MITLHAFMYTHNEQDVIYWCVRKLVEQGIAVTVFDNWSTDTTPDAAEKAGARVIREFGRPNAFWEQEGLDAVQQAASECEEAWCMLHAADEVFASTREGETYRAAVDRLAHEGATFIDHDTRVYRPVDDTFPLDGVPDFEAHFTHWEPDPSKHGQERTWKRAAGLVGFGSLGHRVTLDKRITASERLVRKHYPLRSPKQAARKVFKERRGRGDRRYSYTQYRGLKEDAGPDQFIWDPATLEHEPQLL